MYSIRYMCVFVCLSVNLVYMYDCISISKESSFVTIICVNPIPD